MRNPETDGPGATSHRVKNSNSMINLLCRALAVFVFATGLVAQDDNAGALLASPGGENAGGTGVWILPATTFSVPESTIGNLQIQLQPGGPVFELPQSWIRVGDDILMLIGVELFTGVGFFSAETVGGALLPNSDGFWERTYAPGL